MLQAIRNNAQGVFVWIIVGLIVVSFALFGLGSYLSGASKVVTASVNGVDISGAELTRAYQNYQERLRKMFGDQYRPEMFGTTRIKNEVLQNLITQEVMNQMLDDQGYKASANEVLAKLKKYDEFKDSKKSFSATRYKKVLAKSRMNGEAFENSLSREVASQQLRGAINSSAFLTEEEKKSLSKLENQKREIGYFDIPVKHYQKSINVSDAEIQSHYEKNSQQYLTTEQVQLEYLELNMDDVAASQEVTDEMIKQQYESSPTSYMKADNIAAKKKISGLRNSIMKGAVFSEIAKKHSEDKGSAKQGGDLGFVSKGVEEQFDKVVFALKKGEVSQVIKSKSGFQIIKVEDIRKGDLEERKVSHILIKAEVKQRSFADVKDEIKKELKLQQAGKIFFADFDQLKNLSFETPDTLKPVSDSLGLKIKQTTYMTRRGGAGIFANPKVISAAFSDDVLKQGRNSEVIEISDTQLVVVRIKDHKPAQVQPLKEVKARVENTLRQELANKKSKDVTADILTRVNKSEDIKSILKTYPEAKWNKPSLVSRKADKDAKISQKVLDHAFAMAKPQSEKVTWDNVSLNTGNQAVVAVYKVEENPEAKYDSAKTLQVIGSADYESFVQYLKAQADISISQSALEVEPQNK